MWPLLPGLLRAWLAQGWPVTHLVARPGLPPHQGPGIYQDDLDRLILGFSGRARYRVAGVEGPREVVLAPGTILVVPAACWVEPLLVGPARTCGLRLSTTDTIAYVATHRADRRVNDSLWRRRRGDAAIPAEARRWYAQVVAHAEAGSEAVADRHRLALVVDAACAVLSSPAAIPRGAAATWARIEILLREGDAEDRVALARRAGISVSQLSRLVARFADGNLRRVVNRQRIARAAQLLLATDATVADIASACGFAAPAHFAQRFREIQGCTPREWRRRRAGGDP